MRKTIIAWGLVQALALIAPRSLHGQHNPVNRQQRSLAASQEVVTAPREVLPVGRTAPIRIGASNPAFP
jgi:hypothetical protein